MTPSLRQRLSTLAALVLAATACTEAPSVEESEWDPPAVGTLSADLTFDCGAATTCSGSGAAYGALYRVGASPTSRGDLAQVFQLSENRLAQGVTVSLSKLRAFSSTSPVYLHAAVYPVASATNPAISAAAVATGELDLTQPGTTGDQTIALGGVQLDQGQPYALVFWTDELPSTGSTGSLMIGLGAVLTSTSAFQAPEFGTFRRSLRRANASLSFDPSSVRLRPAGTYDLALALLTGSPCDAVTCFNGGVCNSTGPSPVCECVPGYAGAQCEACAAGYQDNDVNGSCFPTCATAGLSCQHGGVCVEVGAPYCECANGYAGASCQSCDLNYQDNDANGTCDLACSSGILLCLNGGTCQDADGSVGCACPTGYAGATCSVCSSGYQDYDSNGTCTATCATAALSCTTHATCHDTTGTAACSCDAGYVADGANCVLPTKAVFGFTGVDQFFTVPTGVTSVDVKLWGAGGGGGFQNPGNRGGAGGHTAATIAVLPGQVLTVIVGQGGVYNVSGGTYGGGGAGGVPTATASSGGGRSAIRTAGGTELVTAGGGGGSAFNNRVAGVVTLGGAGGGTNGANAVTTPADPAGCIGLGATSGGPGTIGGGAFQGGTNVSDQRFSGGGGGGYWGGGAGDYRSACNGGAGGGGSGYASGAGVSAGVLTAGSSATPPFTTDADYVAAGGSPAIATGGNSQSNGGHGLVVVSWQTPSPTCSGQTFGHPWSTGNRTGTVTVSGTITGAGQLVDGAQGPFNVDQDGANLYYQFTFPAPVAMNTLRWTYRPSWHPSASGYLGAYKIQGSYDGTTFTDISPVYDLGSGSNSTSITSANFNVSAGEANNKRQYYRLLRTVATGSGAPNEVEAEFSLCQ